MVKTIYWYQWKTEAKNYFEKYFFKLTNNVVFGKKMKKTKLKINKPIYLGMSILDINNILMYQFWYDYIKPKYQEKAKLCYMDTDSFIIYIKTEDFYEDIANDVEN